MSNRRMFSNRIGNSAKFLQMPTEAQNLYFHMILRADDDGVVESYPLIKLLGLPPDNFKVLIAKGFIKQLNEDQVIVILDWLEHNTIRADRKVDSIYKHLLPEGVKTIEAKPRSDVEDNSKRLGGQSTDGISQVKLSKDKIIEIVAKSDIPYSLKEEIKKLEDSPRRDLNIVALYFEHRKPDLQNRQQYEIALKRHLKPAGQLKDFTDTQILKALDYAKKEYKDIYTLETLTKILTK